MTRRPKLTKYNPCWCGSGRFYGDCHQRVDNASVEDRVRVAQELYAADWETNATAFANQGCYEWMASQLAPHGPKRLLDIGCGTGQSLLALLTDFPELSIISVEESMSCIEQTAKLLRDAGHEVETVSRVHFVPVGEDAHQLGLQPGRLPQGELPRVCLIEADIISEDDELRSWLEELDPMDAVTVWLAGTHMLRGECLNVQALEVKNLGDYRLRVQNRTYVIADSVLRPGGVIQVVDRGEPLSTDDLTNDCLDSHREQASVTSLTVQGVTSRYYSEPESRQSVKMEITSGTSGRIVDVPDLAMISIISKKPEA